MERRKNEAAYQVNRSAVKKTHFAKSGAAIMSATKPKPAESLGLFLYIRNSMTAINSMS
jgi:hypothetical protein